jgi:hypothetical protein
LLCIEGGIGLPEQLVIKVQRPATGLIKTIFSWLCDLNLEVRSLINSFKH